MTRADLVRRLTDVYGRLRCDREADAETCPKCLLLRLTGDLGYRDGDGDGDPCATAAADPCASVRSELRHERERRKLAESAADRFHAELIGTRAALTNARAIINAVAAGTMTVKPDPAAVRGREPGW